MRSAGLLAVLHFLADADDPAGAVALLRDAVTPGSRAAAASTCLNG